MATGMRRMGSDGLNSQIVEYTADGSVVHIYTVPGHNDGLKLDLVEHQLWALQNEDANPNLVIIDPAGPRGFESISLQQRVSPR
jgi:hypothetical protein